MSGSGVDDIIVSELRKNGIDIIKMNNLITEWGRRINKQKEKNGRYELKVDYQIGRFLYNFDVYKSDVSIISTFLIQNLNDRVNTEVCVRDVVVKLRKGRFWGVKYVVEVVTERV
jgi:hypothetical protein